MKRIVNRISSSIIVCLVISVFVITSVRADAAPPAEPPGSDPGATQQTMVQMVEERVILEIREITTPAEMYAHICTTWAFVKAEFKLVNQGTETETMAVRFPLMDPGGMGDGYYRWPQINDFKVKVNGEYTETFLQTSANPFNEYDDAAPPIPWAAFNVTFKPGEPVSLECEYSLTAMGYLPIENYYYLLETGAGWYGKIGKGDIILRLPYTANAQNVILDDPREYFPDRGDFSGNDYIIHFEDLEPTASNNIPFSIISPFAWWKVLQARENYRIAPSKDLFASSLDLVKALYYMIGQSRDIRQDPGADDLILETLQAANQTIELMPNGYEAHSLFEYILSDLIYFRGEALDEQTIQRYLDELDYLEDNVPSEPDSEGLDWGLMYFQDVKENIIPYETPVPNPKFSYNEIISTSLLPQAEKQPRSSPTYELPAATPTKKQPLITIQCGKIPISVFSLVVLVILLRKARLIKR